MKSKKKTKFSRKCPECKTLMVYKNAKTLANANKNNARCHTCISTKTNAKYKIYDYDKHYNAKTRKYELPCPKCAKPIVLADKRSLRRAILNNSSCKDCGNKKKGKRGKRGSIYDKHMVGNVYVIKCSQCLNNIEFETKGKHFRQLLTNSANILCASCKKQKINNKFGIIFDANSNKWQKPCPECKNIVNYESREGALSSARQKHKCRSCIRKEQSYIDWKQYFDPMTNRYVLKCSDCNNDIEYQSKSGLIRALKTNTKCSICRHPKKTSKPKTRNQIAKEKIVVPTNTPMSKASFANYYNDQLGIWEKECPQCKITIMPYKRRKDLVRSVKGEFVCPICESNNRKVDHTGHPAYDKVSNTWIKNCPECTKKMPYPRFAAYTKSVQKNLKCQSCTIKEVSKRPEVRRARTKNLKSIITTRSSKKERVLFQLIASLGFIHNGADENAIDIAGYIPDILHSRYKLAIEFFGDRFHANPAVAKFRDDDTIIPIGSKKQTAKEIRERDAKRQLAIENEGYKLIVVWENDFNKKANRQSIFNSIAIVVEQFNSQMTKTTAA